MSIADQSVCGCYRQVNGPLWGVGLNISQGRRAKGGYEMVELKE